jgi:hypothetical protein
MSKSNDPADAIGGLVLDVVKIGAWLSWEGGSALYNWMKTPLAVKLQRLTPKEGWGDKIEGVACVSCKTVNERGRTHCFACGQALTDNEDGKTKRFAGKNLLKVLK